MRSFTFLSLTTTLLASTVLGQSSECSDQQYENLPGFPTARNGCYPTTYFRASDLGNTNPSDAQERCEDSCSDDRNCGSVVVSINKAADSDNYSGTCFFYARGQEPRGPRPCDGGASILQGRVKVNCAATTTSRSTSTTSSSTTTSSTTSSTSTTTTPTTSTTSTTTTTTTTPTTSTTTTTTAEPTSTTSTSTTDSTTTTTITSDATTTTSSTSDMITTTTTSTTTTDTTTTTTTTLAVVTPCSTDLSSDRQNCGACGNVCVAGFECAAGVCQQPSPCEPAGDNIYFCNTAQTCTCYTTVEGRGYCDSSPPNAICGQACVTSNDCPNGSVCETGSSSGCPTNACSLQACTNTASVRNIFRGRMTKRYADGSLKRNPNTRAPVLKQRPQV